MNEEKNISVSFRVTPRFKHLPEAAAKRESRSQTNMLETLLFVYCREHGIDDRTNETPSGTVRERKRSD